MSAYNLLTVYSLTVKGCQWIRKKEKKKEKEWKEKKKEKKSVSFGRENSSLLQGQKN